jgi:hypothetical protein
MASIDKMLENLKKAESFKYKSPREMVEDFMTPDKQKVRQEIENLK